MDDIFTVEAECRQVQTKGQRQVKMTFDSQENLSDESLARIAAWHGKYGHLLFLDEEPQPSELSKLPEITEEDHGLSPAQRLRNVIYRVWEEKGKPTRTFDIYYRNMMEQYINHAKEKLT